MQLLGLESNMRNVCINIRPLWESLGCIIADAWRRRRELRKLIEFARLYPIGIDRIAHDLGVNTLELVQISSGGAAWRRLLNARLAALGAGLKILSAEEPEYARDLTRVCALCDSKTRCARDLKRRPDSGIWRVYCPNVSTLNILMRESAVDRMLNAVNGRARS